jgi:hypothetical protein
VQLIEDMASTSDSASTLKEIVLDKGQRPRAKLIGSREKRYLHSDPRHVIGRCRDRVRARDLETRTLMGLKTAVATNMSPIDSQERGFSLTSTTVPHSLD